MKNSDLQTIFNTLFNLEHGLILGILSAPRESETKRIEVRPVVIKEQTVYQWTELRHNQAFHQNFTAEECRVQLEDRLKNYKQAVFFTDEADYHILVSKKQKMTILQKPPSKSSGIKLQHNRPKQYILEQGTPIPFLIELGVMNKNGQVYAQKQDKFKQINRFLEMIADVLPALENKPKLHIVDFGCGKAYLTFALYHYLKIIKGFEIDLIGLDLKSDVIKKCSDLAENLGYLDLQFQLGDINAYATTKHVDMVVSLHACDTATDAALEKAILWQADVILCVPCCQHELYEQVQSTPLEPLLKHGILRERFAALATDAARAQLLEVVGYRAQIMEFIDLEHTPKNLLIRAIKLENRKKDPQIWQKYLEFKHALQIDPSLERRIAGWLIPQHSTYHG